ncbi:sugar ABC transporter ATP-binding protein [Parasalinivibrio latis]|uniref:sugar ABC transporter ATP-binding protein n=1 Tax=Parasalinivibrio latis TaxID=2952610 RepID=UPI0030DFA4D8
MTFTPNTIKISSVKKRFAHNTVLHGIDLTLHGGKVTALLGANGAGKSTLVKILSGVYAADEGLIEIDGVQCDVSSPYRARKSGIVTVHQIINEGVVQDLTVAENLLLDKLCDGRLPTLLNRNRLNKEARAIAESIGLDLPLDKQVSELSQADKQLVSIARALSEQPKLLILDEPTSSLSENESISLFNAVKALCGQGVAVLYISHRMSDIRALADEISTLREGRIVGQFSPPFDFNAAVDSMLGHAIGDISHPYQPGSKETLRFEQVRLKKDARPFNLSLYSGQVTVLTGLLSSGCSHVVEALFGMRNFESGRVYFEGREWAPDSPYQAVKDGVFMVQEDRGNNALIPAFSIADNTSLPFLSRFSNWGFMARNKENSAINKVLAKTQVKYSDSAQNITTLSGGNQQKVMVSRWLLESARVYLLNEPFQGIDISSRRQIGALLRELSAQCAVVVVCSDIEEAFEIADRIIVFNHNNLAGAHTVNTLDTNLLISQIAAAPGQAEHPQHVLENT